MLFPRRQRDRTSDASVTGPPTSQGGGAFARPTLRHPLREGCAARNEGDGQARRQRHLVKRGRLVANRDTFREQGPFTCSRRNRRHLERGDDTRGTRPAHLSMSRPPANACHAGLEPLLNSEAEPPQSEHPDIVSPMPSPLVARGKGDRLGHRSLAPATFFEVRFAGLFEARCRLFVSAITRLTGITRSSS